MRTSLFIAPLALFAAACGSNLDAASAPQSAALRAPSVEHVGEGCVTDADCQSPDLACFDAICVLNHDPHSAGEECAQSSDCAASFTCADRMCVPAGDPITWDVGSACKADADCGSSIMTCVNAVCTLSCEPSVPGTDCTADADCCNPNLICADALCVPNSDPEGSEPPPEGGHLAR